MDPETKPSGTPFELELLLDAGDAELQTAPDDDQEAAEAIDAQILALLVSP